MAVREIIRMGHPVLRQEAKAIDLSAIQSADVQNIINDLKDTLAATPGGIGLAAPQIAESVQIAIVDVPSHSERYGDLKEYPLTVFINPKITVLDPKEESFWEACLSVPGLRGKVSRPQKIKIDYYDEAAQAQTIEVEGFPATVVQHELDHLFGKLYIDRIQDKKDLAFLEEYLEFHDEAAAAEVEAEHKSVLDNVKMRSSTLRLAVEMIHAVTEVGFQWDALGGPIEKLKEEVDELVEAIKEFDQDPESEAKRIALENEVGDVYFCITNISYLLGMNPEYCMQLNLQKFSRRFRAVESMVVDQNKKLEDCSFEEMDRYWHEVKQQEKSD